MKTVNNGPIKKKGYDKEEITESQSEPEEEEKGVYSDNEKSKNYKYSDDDVNGPDWDKDSKDVDTGQNAGVFK